MWTAWWFWTLRLSRAYNRNKAPERPGCPPRHRQVLELIVQGFNNTTIAQRLTLTEKSVETYINAIYQVLQIPGEEAMHSRVKATLVYLQYS